jgi:hypothetical protein
MLQSASAPFVRCDQGASISGADIPAGSTIYNGSGGYESPTTVTMNDNSTCPAECSNVSVTAGAVCYESDTPQVRAVGLCGVTNAEIASNMLNNALKSFAPLSAGGMPCLHADTNIIVCGNSYGLTQPVFNGNTVPTATIARDRTC